MQGVDESDEREDGKNSHGCAKRIAQLLLRQRCDGAISCSCLEFQGFSRYCSLVFAPDLAL